MGGGDIRSRLDWLQPQPASPDFIDSDLNTFKAFGIKPPRG